MDRPPLPAASARTAHGVPVRQYDVQARNARNGAIYEIHWEPPAPELAWPVQVCVYGESCRGALALDPTLRAA